MAYNFPEEEKKILAFWKENQIFQKLQKKNKGKKRWSFLDGPITANNPMGVHHAWGRTYKDALQRYFAMQGYDERYQNGFDCQGLWVEVEVEKEIGFKSKKDIEAYGIDKFVEKCKERVRKYSAIQTAQSIRLGQWMDWERSYSTMSDENNYAIWHFLKRCWEKGYLYKGRDSVPWCPRCGTAISQHEILNEEYKLITHKALYFSLPIIEGKLKGKKFLVWTTTPWTIPANSALAVNPEFEYGVYKKDNEELLLLKSLAGGILGEGWILERSIKGKDLKGVRYSAPFDRLPRIGRAAQENHKTFHTVVLDKDLVTETEGTGIVHIAPGAGEEDFKIGKTKHLPVIEVIDESACYLEDMGALSRKNAKEDPQLIFSHLQSYQNGTFLFKVEEYTHKYPTCWRCKTELVWRVVDEWYIAMDALRKPLERIAKKIHWIPSFGRERELDWLRNMHDWLISKKRYWGLALPIFECACGSFEVIGSKEELKKRAVEGWEAFEGQSPHRPWIDALKIKCRQCKKPASRIKDVGNPWLDAGIVPFSTLKYFSDKSYWKKWFPTQIVCESFPGQFKNWFYAILVMSAVLEDAEPVKTIFGYASVKDEKGEEMHKSKGNAIWFDEVVEKTGADPMRWMYAKQNPADNLLFGYGALDEIKKKLLVLHNVYSFFTTYVKKDQFPPSAKLKPSRILDKWILSRASHLISVVEFNFDKYDMMKAVLSVENFFINDLSLWYVRRSRKRFHEESADRNEAIVALYAVLIQLAKIIAPVMPFFAERMYQDLRTEEMLESVHLHKWPAAESSHMDLDLEQQMDEARHVVNLALAERSAAGIKIRQPLAALKIKNGKLKFKQNKEIVEVVKDEVNVKEIVFDGTIRKEVELDTVITKTLYQEGIARDMVRLVQAQRKEQGLSPKDKISVSFSVPKQMETIVNEYKDIFLKEMRAVEILVGIAEKENETYHITIRPTA